MGGWSKGRRELLGRTMTVAGAGLVCCAARLAAGGPREPADEASAASAGRPSPSDTVLGYCGLYCGGCQTYQETRTGAARDGTGDPKRCDGCASTVLAPWCAECAIKACARGKGLRYCLLCSENPCEKLTAFMNDPRYPYHKDVQRDMVRLKEIGTDAWLREQATRWVCATCGSKYHWFARKCATCGTRVNARHWPD
jgi:hypothetical protein